MATGRVGRGGGALLLLAALVCSGCGSGGASPAGPTPVVDAPGAPGGGGTDAGVRPDASAPDASAPDASAPDASAPDAGPGDAGAPGATLWLHQPSEPKHEVSGGVAVGAAGSLYTVATHGVERAYGTDADTGLRLVVTRLEASGRVVWTRAFAVTRPPPVGEMQDAASISARIAATPDGEVLLAGQVRGSVDFGGGALASGSFLVRLTAEGAHLRTVALPATAPRSYEVHALAADAAGNAYVGVLVDGASDASGCVPMDGRVLKYARSGALLWERSVGEPQCDGNRAEVRALAVDAAGRIALGGAFSGVLRFGERTFRTEHFSPYLAVLEPDGSLAWLQPFSSAWGFVTGVGVSARGTVVATGMQYGTGFIEWAGARLESAGGVQPLFLLVAEADGRARWAKDLGPGERTVLAVEPAGNVIVSGLTRSYVDPQRPELDPANNPQLFASRYGLDGARAWTRIFHRTDGRPDLFAEEVVGAAVLPGTGGSAVLAGQFSTPTDFGTGPRTSANTDVFVLRLAP